MLRSCRGTVFSSKWAKIVHFELKIVPETAAGCSIRPLSLVSTCNNIITNLEHYTVHLDELRSRQGTIFRVEMTHFRVISDRRFGQGRHGAKVR